MLSVCASAKNEPASVIYGCLSLESGDYVAFARLLDYTGLGEFGTVIHDEEIMVWYENNIQPEERHYSPPWPLNYDLTRRNTLMCHLTSNSTAGR